MIKSVNKKTRRQQFDLKTYNSQSMVEGHKISKDYLILVGTFFHIWGYIDLWLKEQLFETTNEVKNKSLHEEKKFRKIAPELFDHGGKDFEICVYKVRQILAHQPMMVHSGANMDCMQFVTGWVYKETQKYQVSNYPISNIPETIPYYPNISESHVLFLIYKMITIIEKYKIPSEIENTLLTFRKSDIYLLKLCQKYLHSKNKTTVTKITHKFYQFEETAP